MNDRNRPGRVPDRRDDPGSETVIYKVLGRRSWQQARRDGIYTGSADDRRDGFIHFSTRDQLRETIARHFAGRDDLVVLGVKLGSLDTSLTWEPSRNGDQFPHLYGPLNLKAVISTWDLSMGGDGHHLIPEDLP